MKTKVMLSLVAMTSAPVAAFADADISSQVGKEVDNWTKSGEDLKLEEGIFISTDGSDISQAIGTLVPGKYLLSATTLENAKLYVNGSELVEGAFELKKEQHVTITVKAVEAGKQFKVGGFNLKLDFDFQAKYSELNLKLSNAAIQLAPNSTDFWEQELLDEYQNKLAVDIAKVKDGDMDSYNIYKEYELYQQPSVIESRIATFAENVTAALANKEANAYATAALAEVQSAWNDLKAALDNASETAKGLYTAKVEAIKSDLENEIAAVKEAHERKSASADYAKATVDAKCKTLNDRILEAANGISIANANSVAYGEVKSLVDSATKLYDEKVQELVDFIVADEAQNSYESLLQLAQTRLAAEYAKITEANAANTIEMAADKKEANVALIKEATAQIVALTVAYETRYTNYKDAYGDVKSTLEDAVSKIEKGLTEIKNTEFDAAIQEIEEKIQAVKSSFATAMAADEDVPDYAASMADIQNKIEKLKSETDPVLDNYNAHQATMKALDALRTKLKEANDSVNALKSEKGEYAAEGRWITTPEEVLKAINGYSEAAEEAYKKGEAASYSFDAAQVEKDIEAYVQAAEAAVGDFERVAGAIADWEEGLAAIKAYIAEEDYSVTDADGKTTYGTKIGIIQKAIDNLKAELAKALALEDTEHKDALAAISPSKPAELTSITQEQFEADKANYQGNINLNAVLLQRTLLSNRIFNAWSELRADMDDKYTADALGKSYNTQNELFLTFETQLINLSDQVPAAEDITKENAAEKRVKLNELNAEMDKIMSDLDKLKAKANDIVDKVKANTNKYNELVTVISGLKERSKEVESKNLDKDNRGDEFKGYYDDIQTSITTLEGNISTSKNNETLVADYTGTEETPGYQKTIEDINAEIDAKVKLAKASTENWNEWTVQVRAFASAEFFYTLTTGGPGLIPQAKTEINAIATPVNAGQTYFLGLVDKYEKQAKELRDSIEAKYGEWKSVEYTNTVKSTIKTLQENIAKAETDAKNNEVAHNLQVEAQVDAQAEWTRVYDRLSAEDKSTQIQTWLDKLTEIQLTINELNETVESNFAAGKCHGSDAESKYTEYKASILRIETQWEDPEGYDKFLAQDNLDRYNRFNVAIAETKKAFDKAVTSLDKFMNIVDDELKVDFNDVLEANEAIYAYNQKIRELKAEVNEAYTTASATSKGVYDLEESFKKQADAYTEEINKIYDECIAKLNDTSKTLLGNALSETNDNLDFYVAKIGSYKESVREAAFSDVKEIIAQAELYKTDPELAVRLAEGFLKTLRNASDLLPAGLEAAAQAQYDALVAELYEEIKANRVELQDYIDNKVLAASYLEKYNEAVAEYVEKAETGLKAVGSAAKEAKKMYESGLAAVEKLIVDFKANDGYSSDFSESFEAYEALQVTFSEVKAELVKLQKYASGYVAVNVQIAEIQQKLEAQISDVEKAKLDGMVHEIMGSVDVICKQLKAEINEQYAECDSLEHAAMFTQISTLYREYNLAVTATEEDIKSYEREIAEYEAELTRINELTEEDEESKREAYMALEKKIGVTRTELTNIYDATYVTNLQTRFSEQLVAISQTQQSQTEALASYNKNVQVAYAEALASIQTKQVALSQKMESYSSESMLLVYSDNITGEIASLNKELESLIGNIDKMQLPFKINGEIKLTLDTKIQTLETTYEELHAKLEGYKYVNIEEFTAAAQTNVVEKINVEKKWIKEAYESEEVGKMLTEESKSKYEANEAKITSNMKELDKQYSYSETTGRIGEVTESMKQTKENLANMQLEEDVKKDCKDQMEKIEKALTALEKYNSDSYRYSLITEDIDGGKLLDEGKNELKNKEIDFVAEAVDAIFNKVDELKKQLAELEQNALNSSYMLGDVNRDKEVTVADYMEILNVVLEQSEFESGSLQFLAADINGDGEISIGDITAVVKIINGTYAPLQARSYARCMPNNSSDRLSLTAEGNGVKQRIAVNLDATLAYTGCQMDIMLPAGVTFVGAEVANRANGFSLNSNELSNGRLRVVLSSLDEADFAHGDGALFYLDVEVSHNYAGNGVGVENILFTDNAVHVYALPAVSGDETTGIGMVSVGEEVKEKIYSVSGKLMNGLKRGVNIIRGNDGTSKKVLVK